MYVSNQGSDTDGDGTSEKPYASLAKAVDEAPDGATVYVMSDLVMSACARYFGKDLTITSYGDNPYTITRGQSFNQQQDDARGTYNPAMIEVASTAGPGTASLTLTNIVLDDNGIVCGQYFIQADSEGDGTTRFGDLDISNGDIVQDAIIATYNGVGTITLGNGAVLKDFGGMSAIRLSDGTLVMEEGSKIVDQVVNDRNRGSVIDGASKSYYGPAGAIWMQGGSATVNQGAEISGIVGRAIYADGGQVIVNGSIKNVIGDSEMWWGNKDKPNTTLTSGSIMHLRSNATATLGATAVIDGGNRETGGASFDILAGCCFTAKDGSVIKNIAGGGSIVNVSGSAFLDGNIHSCTGGGHVICAQSGSNHYVKVGATANIYHNVCSYGVVYTQINRGVIDLYGKLNDNVSTDRAGVVAIANNGNGHPTVNMYDGAEMCRNVCYQSGGAVLVSVGQFVMHGGTISGNISGADQVAAEDQVGGGVHIRRGGQFIMNGGTISNNSAAGIGGNIVIDAQDFGGSSPFVQLKGGSIKGGTMNATVMESNGSYSASGGEANDLAIVGGSSSGNTNRYLSVADSAVISEQSIFMEDYNFYIENPGHNVKLGNASSACETFVENELSSQNLTEVRGSFWYETDAASQSFDISAISYNAEEDLYAAIIATDATGAPITGGEMSLRAVEAAEGGSFTLSVPGQNATGYAVVFVQEGEQPAQVITVTPADITVYEGGDGYSAVVGDNGSIATDNSMPHPIFKIGGVTDAEGMVFANTDAGKSWRVIPDGSGYYHFEPQVGQDDVRVTYTDVLGNAVTNDRFDVTAIGETFAQYAIDLYLGENNLGSITAKQGTQQYAVALGTGTLTVRAVEAVDPATVTSSIADNPPTSTLAPGTALAVVPSGGTIYSLNGTGVLLPPDASPALLFDNIIISDGVDRTAALKNRADAVLGGGSADRQYQMKYLDLVDSNNSNAWITSSAGIDVYWAYPQGTDQSTKFTLLHFKNLHRDGSQSGFDVSDVTGCEVEKEDIERTSQGIRFHVSEGGFSPFVLTWTESSDPDSGGGGTVVPSKVKLTYVENGGSPVADVTVSRGTSVALATPVREGYTFEGWFFDSGLTDPAGMGGARITLYANTTVYAKWSRSETPGSFVTDHINYIMGRETEDGERLIAPLSDVTRAEVATMVFRLLKPELRDEHLTDECGFADVPADAWYAEPVATLAAMGAVKGYPQDGLFHPDDPITRAELVTIVTRLDERFDEGEWYGDLPFDDVPADHWALSVLSFAVNRGWLSGDTYDDGALTGSFRPDDSITRAETMAVLNRMLGRLPESEGDLLPGRIEWPDNQDKDAWYWIVVEEATNNHDHALKADGVHERWTRLLENVAE